MVEKFKSCDAYWIADTATVVGDVTLGRDVSVWYGAVIRGDEGKIVIGDCTNIQDNCVVHEETTIGSNCTIGHGAIVHGCTIGDNTLIGMGAIVLNGAVIGSNCIVGAGAVVTGSMNLPDGSMLLGSPAKTIKPMTEAHYETNKSSAEDYLEIVKQYK